MIFSIITPNYNGMPGLKQCVGSVRNQISESLACKLHHHIQDGGSSDGSVAWLKDCCKSEGAEGYALSFDSVNDDGMYDAINKGWRQTDGDILSWLNHDEQYLPGTLEQVADVFSRYPQVDVVWGDYICVDSQGVAVAARRDVDAKYDFMRFNTCYITSCTVFFHRRLFDRGDLILNSRYKLSADRELFLRLLNTGVRFHHIRNYLSLFTVSEENLSARYHREMMEEDRKIDEEHNATSKGISFISSKIRRYSSKLFRGCYRPQKLRYHYILDEQMHFREMDFNNVSYRHTFK